MLGSPLGIVGPTGWPPTTMLRVAVAAAVAVPTVAAFAATTSSAPITAVLDAPASATGCCRLRNTRNNVPFGWPKKRGMTLSVLFLPVPVAPTATLPVAFAPPPAIACA